MHCNRMTNLTVLSLLMEENVIRLVLQSKYACPFLQFSAIWKFFSDFRWIFILLMSSVGIIECFFGRRLIKATCFLTGFGTGTSISLSLLSLFLVDVDTNYTLIWIIVFASFSIGFMMGYFGLSAKRVAVVLNGVWLGFAISTLLYNGLLYKVEISTFPVIKRLNI